MMLVINKLVLSRNSVRIAPKFVRHYTVNFTSSENNFQQEYDGMHIQTSKFQKALLGLGSAAMSLMDPARGDMIATMGEATGERALHYMKSKMLACDEGSEILRDQPRINSNTVDLKMLENLPEDTLGKVYFNWLKKNKVTPDSRLMVQFVDDPGLAYVMQRYREVHDLVHSVLFMPTNMLGEVTVKWIEGIQTRLPMCIGGGLFGAIRLAPKQRKKYVTTYLPWAVRTGYNSKFLMNVYYEKRWNQPISDLHRELNITPLLTINQSKKASPKTTNTTTVDSTTK